MILMPNKYKTAIAFILILLLTACSNSGSKNNKDLTEKTPDTTNKNVTPPSSDNKDTTPADDENITPPIADNETITPPADEPAVPRYDGKEELNQGALDIGSAEEIEEIKDTVLQIMSLIEIIGQNITYDISDAINEDSFCESGTGFEPIDLESSGTHALSLSSCVHNGQTYDGTLDIDFELYPDGKMPKHVKFSFDMSIYNPAYTLTLWQEENTDVTLTETGDISVLTSQFSWKKGGQESFDIAGTLQATFTDEGADLKDEHVYVIQQDGKIYKVKTDSWATKNTHNNNYTFKDGNSYFYHPDYGYWPIKFTGSSAQYCTHPSGAYDLDKPSRRRSGAKIKIGDKSFDIPDC